MLSKLNLNKMLTFMLAISVAIFSGYELMSQPTLTEGEFINNTGGTYKAGNTTNKKGGIIRMKGSATTSGKFTGEAALGASQATRIEGTVIWAKDGEQDVQPRYYTNLGVAEPLKATTGNHVRNFDAAADNIGDGVTSYFVSGDFMRYGNTLRARPLTDAEAITFRGGTGSSASNPTDVTYLPIIEHACSSDFWYDGTEEQAVLGTIMEAESGVNDNYYAHLRQFNEEGIYLGSNTYTQVFTQVITGGGHSPDITQNGALTIAANAAMFVELLADLCDTIKEPTIIDTVEVGDCDDPEWVVNHPGIVCPEPPTVPCDTCDPCEENPAFVAGHDVVIEITGGITYDGKEDGSNLPFCFNAGDACLEVITAGQEPTRVIYRNTADGIYPAHYGILEIGSDVDHDINLIGNVYIKGKRPYALDHKGSSNIVTGYGLDAATGTPNTSGTPLRITFEDMCAQPTYASCGEVEGWIYRSASDDRLYTYHNAATTARFANVSEIPHDGNTANQWFGLLSLPDENITTAGNTLSSAKPVEDVANFGYINRIWRVDFAAGNAAAAIAEMHLGNSLDEIPEGLQGDKWARMRGYEAWDQTLNPALLVGEGGLAWAWRPDGTTAPTTGTGTVCNTLFTMDQGGKIFLVADADEYQLGADVLGPQSQIVFGNVPTMVQTVQNGRWSNPMTWGGMTPQKEDSVVVRHLVYTGIYDGTGDQILGSAPFSRNEHDLPGVEDATTGEIILAKYVDILSVTDLQTLAANSANKINSDYSAGLIVGNYDVTGATSPTADPEGTAMNFDQVLTFGVIDNKNTVGSTWTTGNSLSYTGLKTNILGFGGFYQMGDQTTVPVTNAYIFVNSGAHVNDAIFEIGK